MNTIFIRTAQLIVALLIVCPLGCQLTPTRQAEVIRDHTQDQAARIDAAVDQAGQHIDKADNAVIAATTQPNNPPATQANLTVAHAQLGFARVSLAPVRPATAAIRSDATQAAQVTARVDAQLTKVNASFWSPRQKRLAAWTLGSLLVLGILAGVLAFFSHSVGLTPTLQVLGDVLGGVFRGICRTARLATKSVFHIGTLGLAYVGARFGKAVRTKAAAAAVSDPANTPRASR